MTHLIRGTAVGLCCGAAVFAADLAVTAHTHGHRFEATQETFVLIGAVALVCLIPGLILGFALALILKEKGPQPWLYPIATLVIALAGFYLLRKEQHVVPDGLTHTVAAQEKRDVVWLVVDTLRADELYASERPGSITGASDSAFTYAPNIGAFAKKSTTFREAEAPSGWTIPSTAGLLTGRHPATLGADGGLLPAGADTLAELLQSAGWSTVAHIDNTLLDESNGFAAGFDRFVKRSPMDFAWRLQTSQLLPLSLKVNMRHRLHISYSGVANLVDRAVTDLEAAEEKPLFLYVHAMDVHAPYWSELNDPEQARIAAQIHGMDGTGRESARKNVDSMSEAHRVAIRAQYRAEIEYVDREFGRLLSRFDELRGLENAIVVLTSDHGEEFWEHGKMGHGISLWGEAVRVPLILHTPADLLPNAAPIVDTPVSLIDVAPTVADLLGLKGGEGEFEFEGRSLLPSVRGETFDSVPLHSEQFRFNRTTHRWRDGDLVLVDAKLPDNERMLRLFDVSLDPEEAHDLSADRPDDLARLRADLKAHLAGIKRDGTDTGSAQRNSEGLENLGY